jgi:LacI family transcriptional regulator
MTPQRPSISHIAAETGFHHSTISRALRNDPRISKETRRIVRDAATRLGYQPNPKIAELMRLLRQGRAQDRPINLAFLTFSAERHGWQNWWKGALFDGCKARASELGYHLEDFWTQEPGVTSKHIARILQARGVEAILLPEFTERFEEYPFPWHKFSVVKLSMTHPPAPFHFAGSDHIKKAGMIWRISQELGYRKLSMVTSHSSFAGYGYIIFGRLMAEIDQSSHPPIERFL